jgi:hypothetical protein
VCKQKKKQIKKKFEKMVEGDEKLLAEGDPRSPTKCEKNLKKM